MLFKCAIHFINIPVLRRLHKHRAIKGGLGKSLRHKPPNYLCHVPFGSQLGYISCGNSRWSSATLHLFWFCGYVLNIKNVHVHEARKLFWEGMNLWDSLSFSICDCIKVSALLSTVGCTCKVVSCISKGKSTKARNMLGPDGIGLASNAG